MTRIVDVITELYSKGIDCGVESYRGFGITAWIVDERNRRIERGFEIQQADAIPEWLRQEAAVQLSGVDHRHEPDTLSLLAELMEGARKDPKQVSSRERDQRREVNQSGSSIAQ